MWHLLVQTIQKVEHTYCNKYIRKKIDLIIRSIFFVVIELNIYMPTYAFDLNGNVTVDRWNINTYSYEQKHLCSHIEQFYDIDSFSEEAAYLAGSIAKLMFPVAKKYLTT